MKIKSERDFFSGLMFLVVGIVFAIGATNYSLGAPCPPGAECATSMWARFIQLSARPGPGFFPLGLGVIMAALGGVVLFKALTIETEGGDPIGAIAWRPLLVIVLAIAVFGAGLPRLGMVITVPLLIVIVSFAGGEFRWKGVAVNSVVLTAFAWLVFVYGLKLTIPLWPAFVK